MTQRQVFAVGLTAVAAIVMLLFAKKKKESIDNDRNLPPTNNSAPSKGSIFARKNSRSASISMFPWEPSVNSEKEDTRGSRAVSQDVKRSKQPLRSGILHQNSKPQTSRDKQIDFLASMTFANGGLRAPSCPCCV